MQSDEQLFCRHIDDICLLSYKRQTAVFTNFLTEHEQRLAEITAKTQQIKCSFFGGYENAERKVFAVGEPEAFPVTAITFRFRRADTLTHRDFLGALIALGIKRELIGDIAVGEGYAIVFCIESIADMLTAEIDKIGRVGVEAEKGFNEPFPEQEFSLTEGMAASLRIDCIVAAATMQSREKAIKLIKSGLVQLNGAICQEPSKEVNEGAKLSIRGFGKYMLDKVGSVSRKGKFHIEIKKFV